MKNDADTDRKAALSVVASRLASHKLSDAQVSKLADAMFTKLRPVRMDPCIYGICLEYDLKISDLSKLDLSKIIEVTPGRIRGIDIMIDGIINPEALRVRVGQELG